MKLEALEFYLENYEEMDALFADVNIDIIPDSLNKNEVLENVKIVGTEANEQASTLLYEFSNKLLAVLENKVGIRRSSNDSTIKRDWVIKHVLWDRDTSSGKEWLNMIGATFEVAQNKCYIWFYKYGDSSSEEKVLKILNQYFGTIQSGKKVGYGKGNLILLEFNLTMLIGSYRHTDNVLSHDNFFSEIAKITKAEWTKILRENA